MFFLTPFAHQWLQDREDFADLQSEQDACGPVFIRQALLTPGHKRGPHEVAVLAQWLQSKCHFSHLRPTQLETVVRSLTHAAIGPNQTLQPERRAVYFVLSGKAIMTKPGMPRAVVRCSWWSSIASGRGGGLGAQHSLQHDTQTTRQARVKALARGSGGLALPSTLRTLTSSLAAG